MSMELSELLERQRDNYLCVSPFIDCEEGPGGNSEKPPAAIFRSIPVGVMRASLNEVKEDRRLREAFAHEQFHFGWMTCLPSFHLTLLAKLWGLLKLEAFLNERKKQQEIDLSWLRPPNPYSSLNNEENAAMDFALEALSIFEMVYIDWPPWDPHGADYLDDLYQAPDPFYRESFRVLINIMDRLMETCGLKGCRRDEEGFGLIGKILTAGSLLPLLEKSGFEIVKGSKRGYILLIKGKESKFGPGLMRIICQMARQPFWDSVMYLNKLNDNPKLANTYASKYNALINTTGEAAKDLVSYVERRVHDRKKEGVGNYLSYLCLWFAETLFFEKDPYYQLDTHHFEINDLIRYMNISNLKDHPISNRPGMIFLLSDEVLRPYRPYHKKMGALFDPNYRKHSDTGSMAIFSWMDVLFSDWILSWEEEGGLLRCPMVYAQEKLSCFEHGCPLSEEDHVPSKLNGHCAAGELVKLDEVKERDCLFWNVFTRIFEGFNEVKVKRTTN